MSDADIKVRIIEEAETVFAKYGYKKANLEDIAARLDKGKSFIYYYFKNKEEIFAAVLKKESDKLVKELTNTAEAEGSTRKKLHNFILAKARIIREVVNFSRILKEEYFTEKVVFENLRTDLEKEEFAIVCRIFKSGVESRELKNLDPEWTAETFLTAMKGFEFPLLTRDSYEDIEKRSDVLLELLFYGIAADKK